MGEREREREREMMMILKKSTDLTGNCYLIVRFIADRALWLVCVIECDGDCGLCYASLPTFIHQLLETTGSHLQERKGEREREREGGEGPE